MKIRSLALVSLAIVAPTLLAGCPPQAGPGILAPRGVVTEFSFEVQVRVPGDWTLDPASDVTLNGVVLPVSGGPLIYTATVQPGFPLQDQNQISARFHLPNGVTRVSFANFEYAPPKARVRQISDAADLIEGPLAHGRVGDWLIENSVARFIVQDVAQRDLYSVGAFGGNIIDIELLANPGNDNFLEIQPMLNVETVVNAQTLEVVNDGQDGTAAILRTCGPDDLLDFVKIRRPAFAKASARQARTAARRPRG